MRGIDRRDADAQVGQASKFGNHDSRRRD